MQRSSTRQESSSASKSRYDGASSSAGDELTVTLRSGPRVRMCAHGARAVSVSRPLADLWGSGGAEEVETLVWQGKEEAEDGQGMHGN